MLRHLSCAIALVALGSSVACSSGPGEEEGERAGDQLIETGAPIKPADLLKCWTVEDTAAASPFFTRHKLVCQQQAPTTYPLVQNEAIVEVRTAQSRSFSQRMTTGDEIQIGLFATDDLPLSIQTRLIFPKTSTVGQQFALKRENKINRLADATKATPLAFKSPFTLWGVAIRATDGNRLFLSGHYEAPSGEYRVGWNFNIPETDPQTLKVNPFQESTDGKMELAMIAPASGTLKVSLLGRDVDIAGPGAYVWNGESLTRDTTVPAPVVPPDVVDLPPAPTCGVPAMPLCEGGTCAPAHRLVDGACKPCGTDGLTYCGTGSNPTCADGHRNVDYVCRACGTNGLTYCGTGSAPTCNPGHRVVDYVCRSCGADGQTYCGTGSAPTCNPGHRVVDYVCRACGGEGQTYCGTGSSPTCNQGLRVVDYVCRR